MALSNEIKRLKKLKYFNESPVSIVYITEHNSTVFVVTTVVFFTADSKDVKVTGIRFAGHDLEMYKQGYTGEIIYLNSYVRHYTETGLLRDLHIDTIRSLPEQRNKGYGTILLSQFIEYAKTLGVESITGSLSFVDEGNKERRSHFYIKHGFVIDGARIRLDLAKSSKKSPAS